MRGVKRLLIHLLAMVGLGTALAVGAYFYLFKATRHGEALETPHIKHLPVDQALELLQRHRLEMVVHDSVFHPEQRGVVLEQTPGPGELVKPGRKIYVVVSRREPGKVAFPDIIDMPLEQAVRTLDAVFLKVDSVVYVPDISEGLVIKALWKGREMAPGDSIRQLERVVLVVSKGLEATESPVPDVRGLRRDEAELILVAYGFQPGNVIFPPGTIDSNALVVGRQHPEPSETSRYPRGYLVDLWMIDSTQFILDTALPPHEESEFNLFEE